MAIISLEEFQTEAYDDTVGAYTFECECMGAVSDEQPELIAKKPGITLHLLRYGLFNEEAKKSYKEVKARQEKGGEKNQKKELPKKDDKIRVIDGIELPEVVVTPKEPRIKGYRYGYTSLREGYVYILDESDLQNKFLEYKVDELGSSVPIIWKKGSTKEGNDGYYDIREPEGGDKAITMEQDSVLWIAFSPVQWTVAYHKEMRSNAEKREERMEKIICSGFRKGQASPYNNAFPYDEIRVHFNQSQLAEPQWLSHKLDQMKADDDCAKSDDDLKEDMFIILADPISCADDIAEDLNKEFLRLRAMIESMQTGVDDRIIFERIIRGEERNGSLTEEQKQINYLFQIAQTSYSLVYNDEASREEYAGEERGLWKYGTSKDKLIKVLGVKERKAQREVIRKHRDAFGTFLQSQYYQEAWHEYTQNLHDRILDGKIRVLQQISLLALHYHDTDKHLDLRNENESKEDNWQQYLFELSGQNMENPICKLLKANSDWGLAGEEDQQVFDKNKVIDLGNKAGGVICGVVEAFGKLGLKEMIRLKSKTTYSIITKELHACHKMLMPLLKQVTHYGDEMLEIREIDFENEKQFFPEGFEVDEGKVVPGKYRGNKTDVKRIVKSEDAVLVKKARGKNIIGIVLKKEYTEKIATGYKIVEEKFLGVDPRAAKAKAILNSPAFKGAIGLLQAFNLSVAISQLDSENSWKSGINLTSAGLEMSSISLKVVHSRMLVTRALQPFAGRVWLAAEGAGVLGSGLGVIVCFMEALDSFKDHDQDAMLAWVGAGVCFGYMAYAGLATAGTLTAPLTLPVIIVGLISLGFVLLANYLKDTALQNYFANFPLSDTIEFNGTTSGIQPWKYNLRVVTTEKEKLIVNKIPYLHFWRTEQYNKWADFRVAYQDLLDVIICNDIVWEPNGFARIKTARNVDAEGYIAAFSVLVSFRKFLQYEDQLETQIFYFPEGVGKGDGIDLKKNETFKRTSSLSTDKRGIPAVRVHFNMPKEYIPGEYENKRRESGEILFVCRLKAYKDEYYPFNFDSEKRTTKVTYLGAKFPTYAKIRRNPARTAYDHQMQQVNKNHNIQSNVLSRSNVRIDSLENLKQSEDWEILDNYQMD